MRAPTLATLAALALTGAIVVSACAGTSGSTGSGQSIDVVMDSFAFRPATLTLTAGERVTLRFKNVSTVEHEFMAGRQGVPGKGYTEDLLAVALKDQSGGHGMGGAAGIRVDAAKSASLTFRVPDSKGKYEFGCFVPGHYEAGMKGTLVIE